MSALPPASCAVECGGRTHRLHWADGTLHAVDHPDPERERALTALGGEGYPCLEVLDVWERHRADLDVLLLGPRRREEAPPDRPGRIGVSRLGVTYSGAYRPMSAMRRGWHAYAPLSGGPPAPRTDLDDVLALPGGLPLRLTAQVVDAWAARLAAGEAQAERPRLHAAVYGRLAPALRTWLAEPGVRVELTLADGVALERAGERVRARVPFTWLSDVWLPGLAVVADRFTLAAAGTADGGRTLDTADRELARADLLLRLGPPR